MTKIKIPKLSDKSLGELAEQVKPIVKGHYIQPVHLSNIAFTWAQN